MSWWICTKIIGFGRIIRLRNRKKQKYTDASKYELLGLFTTIVRISGGFDLYNTLTKIRKDHTLTSPFDFVSDTSREILAGYLIILRDCGVLACFKVCYPTIASDLHNAAQQFYLTKTKQEKDDVKMEKEIKVGSREEIALFDEMGLRMVANKPTPCGCQYCHEDNVERLWNSKESNCKVFING